MAATTNGTMSSVHQNGTANGGTPPKIHLYTNHRCPYAHRAHITLEELGLPFEETIIDLDTPRPQWYLDINPRGLVPTMKYSVPGVMPEETIIESAVVSQFLVDSFPSHLLPATREDPTAPLRRAKINFFVDTWTSKIFPHQMGIMKASGDEQEEKVQEMVAAVKKEIEPLLADAAPFFGGSKELTFAEAMTAPFVVRAYAISRDGELMPKSLAQSLDSLPNFGKWAKAVSERQSVQSIYDEEESVEGFKKKFKQMQAKK